MRRFSRWSLWAVFALVGLGCSADRQPGELFGSIEDGVLVLDGSLIVDQPLPDLFVRRTADPRDLYIASAYGVSQATVELASQGSTWRYTADPDEPGRYLPPERPLVEPHTTYTLAVQVGEEMAGGVTTTPGRLDLARTVLLDEESLEVVTELIPFTEGADRVFSAPENQLVYRDGILEMQLAGAVEDAAAYQLSLTGLDRDSGFVIDADFLEADNYEDFERDGASPAVEADDGRAFPDRHASNTGVAPGC